MALTVLTALSLVYVQRTSALERRGAEKRVEADAQKPAPGKTAKPLEAQPALPAPVEEMRQALLTAAHSGNVDELRVPLDWNELPPDVDAGKDDPIAHWKKVSGDGEGREILAVLSNILPMRPAELPLGKDLENNIIYVWPYLAETPLDKLTPAQEVDLLRLMSPQAAKAMRAKGKWTWWRLAIGADGTWHSFRKAE